MLRFSTGNLGGHKSVGGGVWEARVMFGPGCRIYLGKDGSEFGSAVTPWRLVAPRVQPNRRPTHAANSCQLTPANCNAVGSLLH